MANLKDKGKSESFMSRLTFSYISYLIKIIKKRDFSGEDIKELPNQLTV